MAVLTQHLGTNERQGRGAAYSGLATKAPAGRGSPATDCRTLHLGQIGLAIARTDSNRVYALIETGDGAPWNGQPTQIGQLWAVQSTGGATWQPGSPDPQSRGRTAYYTRVAVAPDNENEVVSVASSLSLSLDSVATISLLCRAAPGPFRVPSVIITTSGSIPSTGAE